MGKTFDFAGPSLHTIQPAHGHDFPSISLDHCESYPIYLSEFSAFIDDCIGGCFQVQLPMCLNDESIHLLKSHLTLLQLTVLFPLSEARKVAGHLSDKTQIPPLRCRSAARSLENLDAAHSTVPNGHGDEDQQACRWIIVGSLRGSTAAWRDNHGLPRGGHTMDQCLMKTSLIIGQI